MVETTGAPQSLDEFPDQVRKDVDGLIWVGSLTDDFSEFGHNFSIRTLKGEEELITGLLTKEYQDTMMQVKAFAWANVSLALTSVDYNQNFCPDIGPDPMENARGRFRWCLTNWHWPVCKVIFDRLQLLVVRQEAAVAAMRDLSLRSPTSFSPSPDSTTDQADSEREVPLVQPEIIQHLDED
jgi:hypothetical protein